MTAYPAGDVRCAVCGDTMTFLEWEGHVHPDAPCIPAVGPTSEGLGELAGGDVQAMPPRPKSRRRGNRHDQRTPLPGDPGFVRPSVTADVIRNLLGREK